MIGVLGGTNFREAALDWEGRAKRVVTPWGSIAAVEYKGALLVDRHGKTAYTPPHRINHHANLDGLLRAGATALVSFGSVGSLREEITPGTLLLVDDLFMPGRVVTWFHDRIHFTVPGFDPRFRAAARDCLDAANINTRDGGVYAQTVGPRFETVSEVRALARDADVVGMTCASEAVLAMEREVPHVILAMVDNYAHGVGLEPLSGEAFQAKVRANRELAMKALEALLGLKYPE